VLQQMQRLGQQVAAVVNEFGETIGILTYDDILDTVFHHNPSRTDRLLDREPIQEVGEDCWHVTGMTGLRRLARHFDVELPHTTSVTVGGIIQELLQRLAREGDEIQWGQFHFRVLAVPQRGQLRIELKRAGNEEHDS
jgi:CBS domain containing-hemolysin-like protein